MDLAATRRPRRTSRVQAADALQPRKAVARVGESRAKLSSRSSTKALAYDVIEVTEQGSGRSIAVFKALNAQLVLRVAARKSASISWLKIDSFCKKLLHIGRIPTLRHQVQELVLSGLPEY